MADSMKSARMDRLTGRHSEQGSALIFVMVVLALMAGLAALFSLESLGGVQESRNYRDGTASRMLAHAGIEAALHELSMPQTRCVKDGWGELYFIRTSEAQDPEVERLRKGRTGRELEPGYWFSWSIRLCNEQADLNRMDETKLHRLLEIGCGMEEGEKRSALVNAILDWMDADDNTRLNGAEESYYQDLDTPRHCKNAGFDSIEELLLVKGMTRQILWGSPDEQPITKNNQLQYGGGIARYIDIGSNNSNEFLPENLELKYILTGSYDETARREDLVLADEDKDVIQRQGRPGRIRVIGRGWLAGGVSRHAMMILMSGSGNNMTVYQWHDNATDRNGCQSIWEGYKPLE